MREQDIDTLWHFTLRMRMYIPEENKHTIVAFLHGYDQGTDHQCSFFTSLSKRIEQVYHIKSTSTWWPGQISLLSKQLNKDWIIVFKILTISVLLNESGDTKRLELLYDLKNSIIRMTNNVDRHFRKSWLIDWFGFTHFEEAWFLDLWPAKELELLKELNNELIQLGDIGVLEEQIELSTKVEKLCQQFTAINHVS